MWQYQQQTGRLFNPHGQYVATGYAGGNCGKRPDAVNNPDMQNVKDCGPLPRGIYTMGIPFNHPTLGIFAIPLTPDISNEMYGRGSFYIHGDTPEMNKSASDGCIIMPRYARNICAASDDKQIQVV